MKTFMMELMMRKINFRQLKDKKFLIIRWKGTSMLMKLHIQSSSQRKGDSIMVYRSKKVTYLTLIWKSNLSFKYLLEGQ